MAAARPSPADSLAPLDGTALRELLAKYRDHPLTTPVQAAAFWAAVALPAVYLSLLAVGPEAVGGKTAFFGLVALHAVAVVAGHDYQR